MSDLVSPPEPAEAPPEDADLRPPGRALDYLLRRLARLLSAVFHDLRVEGRGHVPATGPVILASNHPTYLDPVYIMCRLRRPVRFLAWERPFRVPVLGWLLRHYGAIPVDIDKPGRGSFEAAVKVLKAGQVFGIFPEGGRSKYGTMNPLKSGVARLAMISGATIVPVTIRGAHRVWPKGQLLPRPGRVEVEFHEPIRLAPDEVRARRRDRDFEAEIVDRVLRAINSSLLPSLRAERRGAELLKRAEPPWSWWVEGLPFLFWVGLGISGRGLFPEGWAALGYAAYLALDSFVIPRSSRTLAVRNFSPWLAAAGMAAACGLRPAPGWRHPTVVTAALLSAAALAWLQAFRFPDYRAFRPWLLAGLYAFLMFQCQ